MPPLYDGLYTVIQRSLRSFKLQMVGKENKVSTSRLKSCSSSTPTAAPPICRRPLLHPTADPPPPSTHKR
jgi:hypothetical protein